VTEERPSLLFSYLGALSLQWSLGDVTEESCQPEIMSCPAARFNGASVMSPRKGRIGTAPDDGSSGLQWSLGDVTEESRRPGRKRPGKRCSLQWSLGDVTEERPSRGRP